MQTTQPMSNPADRQFSAKLEADIAHKLEVNAEAIELGESDGPPMTRAEAIMEMIQDMDSPDHYASDHRRELQDFGIEVGIYEVITREQIANMVTSGGRSKRYDFKRGGVHYIFGSWEPLGIKM